MDSELRLQVLRALAKDRQFLKAAALDVRPEIFRDRGEAMVARVCVEFWEKYGEPIGGMLRSWVQDEVRRERFGSERKKELAGLLDTVLNGKLPYVSVRALQDRVKRIKTMAFYEDAVEEVVSSYEKGELSVETLVSLVERANKETNRAGFHTHDYFAEADKRVERRKILEQEYRRYPKLMIDELDRKIRMIGRGQLGIFVASYNSGKGMALLHTAIAYAIQGLKVIFLTLEDPADEVGNRMDANITGIPMKMLNRLPNRFRKRYRQVCEAIRGKIKIVDGTDGGWTVTQMEKLWWELKSQGFEADAFIVDYDDEIECEKVYKGESARRFEFAEIYRRMRRAAAKLQVIWWTASQGNKKAESKTTVTGVEVAEDISKVRKAFLGIGIGSYKDDPDMKHLFVMRHRLDRARFGVDIITRFESGLFYDREATAEMHRIRKARRARRRERRAA